MEDPAEEPPWWSSCDELRCTSTSAFGELFPGVGLPWCWANLSKNASDFSCSDGYTGVALSSVEFTTFPDTEGVFQYYTCCPKVVDSEEGGGVGFVDDSNSTLLLPPEVLPQCSPHRETCKDYYQDCIGDGLNEPMSCHDDENGIYVYPHRTPHQPDLVFQSWNYSYYRCCSAPHQEESTIMLPESFRFAFSLLASFLTLSLVLAILCNRSVRRQSFNLYIVSLTVSDFLMNFIGTLVSGSTVLAREAFPSACLIHFFPVMFYSVVNYWLNVLIINEIHKLLKQSKAGRRNHPPSIQKVVVQSLAVYGVAGISAFLWMYIHCIKVPEPTEKIEYSSSSEYQILYLLGVLFNGVVPLLYLVTVLVHIWRAKLVPRTGQMRTLVYYFLRIIIIFVFGTCFIMPLLAIAPLSLFLGSTYVSRCLISLLTMIAAFLAMTKPDIGNAVLRLWTCQRVSGGAWGESSSSSSFLSSTLKFVRGFSWRPRRKSRKESHDGSGVGGSNHSPSPTDATTSSHFGTGTKKSKTRRCRRPEARSKPNLPSNRRRRPTNKGHKHHGDGKKSDEEENKEEEEEIIIFGEDESSELFFTNLPPDSIWNQRDEWWENTDIEQASAVVDIHGAELKDRTDKLSDDPSVDDDKPLQDAPGQPAGSVYIQMDDDSEDDQCQEEQDEVIDG